MRGAGVWIGGPALALFTHLVVAAQPAAAAVPGPASEAAGGVAYEGEDRVRVRLDTTLAAAVEEYANAGYRLGLGPGSGEATVEVTLAPLASRAPFDLEGDVPADDAGGEGAGEVAAAAREAVAGAATVHQAVSAVLGWIVRHVGDPDAAFFVHAPEAAAGGGQGTGGGGTAVAGEAAQPGGAKEERTPSSASTPLDVIARGAGDAEAVARLAVTMLRTVGIEARPVRGRVVGPPRPGAPRGPHAWIEVRYPDRGWLFSDPLHHHHYVPATYLRLATVKGVAASSAAAEAAELVERRDRRVPVDVYPSGAPGIGARTNGGPQVAAALRVVVPGASEGAVVLTAADGSARRRALLDGEGVFVGLAGGTYRLEVLLPGREGLTRVVEIAARERSAVVVTGEAGARQAPPGASRQPPGSGGPADAQGRGRSPRSE